VPNRNQNPPSPWPIPSGSPPSRPSSPPYGTVGFRTATKLDVPNEELTIALLERYTDADIYLRSRKFLNLEALETLSDSKLLDLKIQRITADKLTVTPAKIDLGKAVKKAAEAGA
jgi:hypothetical protein